MHDISHQSHHIATCNVFLQYKLQTQLESMIYKNEIRLKMFKYCEKMLKKGLKIFQQQFDRHTHNRNSESLNQVVVEKE